MSRRALKSKIIKKRNIIDEYAFENQRSVLLQEQYEWRRDTIVGVIIVVFLTGLILFIAISLIISGSVSIYNLLKWLLSFLSRTLENGGQYATKG